MRSIIIISLLVFTISGTNCSRDGKNSTTTETDQYGVVISKEYKWKFYLHESGTFHRNGYFKQHIIYKRNLVIPTTNINGEQQMSMINSKNAELLWNWNSQHITSTNPLKINGYFKQNDIFIWQQNKITHSINLTDGTSNWTIDRNTPYYSHFNSYKNSYLTYGLIIRDDNKSEKAAHIGNCNTSENELFLRANLSCEYAAPISDNEYYGGILYINEIPNSGKLLVTYDEPLPAWKVRMMFGLYDPDTETWIYERKELIEPHWNAGVQHTPIIYNNNVYAAAGNSIVCHDIITGEQLWRRDFPQDFMFSGFIIEEGKIIAMCEDTILYCLDPETGETVWEGEGAGTSSVLSYLNGVVYFVGGSTRKLHAVDISTGRTVWRIDSSIMGDEYDRFGPNAVYVIPGENGEKGKVIALTSMYAICYEAYK